MREAMPEQQQLFSHVPISCFTRRRLLIEAYVRSSTAADEADSHSPGAQSSNPETASTESVQSAETAAASASASARASAPAAVSVETREWLECTASGALPVAHQHDPRAFFDASANANGLQANANAATPPPFSILSGTRLQRLLAGELPSADTVFDSYRRVTQTAAAAATPTLRPVGNSTQVTKTSRPHAFGEASTATGITNETNDSLATSANNNEHPSLDTFSQPSSIWSDLHMPSLEGQRQLSSLQEAPPSSIHNAPPSSIHNAPPSSLQGQHQPASFQDGVSQPSSLLQATQLSSLQLETQRALLRISLEDDAPLERSRSVGSSDRTRLNARLVAARNLRNSSALRGRHNPSRASRLVRLPSVSNDDDWRANVLGSRHNSLRTGREASVVLTAALAACDTLLRMRLEVLDLSSNQLRSLEPLAALARNDFPIALALFQKLQKLSLAENALSNIPYELFLPLKVWLTKLLTHNTRKWIGRTISEMKFILILIAF